MDEPKFSRCDQIVSFEVRGGLGDFRNGEILLHIQYKPGTTEYPSEAPSQDEGASPYEWHFFVLPLDVGEILHSKLWEALHKGLPSSQ